MSEPTDPALSTTLTTVCLGIVGGALSLVFGGNTLTLPQRVGCVVAGGAVAFVSCPLISLFWSGAPEQLFGVTGFLSGLVGMNLVRGILAWSNRYEKRLPDTIDRKIGGDKP